MRKKYKMQQKRQFYVKYIQYVQYVQLTVLHFVTFS